MTSSPGQCRGKQDSRLKSLYVFGAGGSGRETAWLAREVYGSEIQIAFLVDSQWKTADSVNDIPVRDIESLAPHAESGYVAAIGSSVDRQRAVGKCEKLGLRPVSLVHPKAVLSPWVVVGDGTIICAGTVITTNVVVGRHVQVNIGCTVSHDVRIDDFATLSPGVHIAGNVWIQRDVFLGIGVSIINGAAGNPLVIGEGAVVAAGACVTNSVNRNALVAGVPAVTKRCGPDHADE